MGYLASELHSMAESVEDELRRLRFRRTESRERRDRLKRIRDEVRCGTYDIESKLDLTVERLMIDL